MSRDAHPSSEFNRDTLKLLSFNMQTGVGTKRPHQYVTRSWRNLLPSLQVRENLARIAELTAGFDFVGLQEVDAGSHRSGYENQIEYIADRAGFAFWHIQVNRNLGRIAQHGIGLLTRYQPFVVSEHALPGHVPGRGALIARFGDRDEPLTVVVTHLALTAGSRSLQLAAILDLVGACEHVIVLGDTNSSARHLASEPALANSRLRVSTERLPTFPSWRPRRDIDHILVTPSLTIHSAHAIPSQLSDHLPISMTVGLPPAVAAGLHAAEQMP